MRLKLFCEANRLVLLRDAIINGGLHRGQFLATDICTLLKRDKTKGNGKECVHPYLCKKDIDDLLLVLVHFLLRNVLFR